MGIPPWKPVLEAAIQANKAEKASVYVQLATVKANGRPSNRTIVYRGFFTVPDDILEHANQPVSPSASSPNIGPITTSPVSPPATTSNPPLPATHTAYPNPPPPDNASRRASNSSLNARPPAFSSMLVAGKLSSLLEFVTDIRSAKCIEEMGTGKETWAEVCWYFPTTREQFRLSGSLHLIAPEGSVLAQSHLPAWAPKHLPWEAERLRLWRAISPGLRASFSWGTPGQTYTTDGEEPLNALDCLIPDESAIAPGSTMDILTRPAQIDEPEEEEGVIDLVVSTTSPDSEVPPEDPKRVLRIPSLNIPLPEEQTQIKRVARSNSIRDQRLIRTHDEALSHFGVLLLDVDFVDHLDLVAVPQKRTQYKVHVPERTFGRITGLDWDVRRVFP